MPFPYYTGDAEEPRKIDHAELTLARRKEQNEPRGYTPDEGLRDAVNVALLLGQPLLLTGEPGTGKTQLAYSVSWELGFDPPLVFETKSTSTARDLFYTYDTVGRFHAAYAQRDDDTKKEDNPLDYITYNALGKAILFANEEKDVERLLPKNFKHGGRRRSVVLIDEIDKAPRDFPNDILNEVEGMYFKIPELRNEEVRANESMRPVLILTSNSEKNLPEAFLRRCVYYHIEFPDRKRLRGIVESRISHFSNNQIKWLEDALDLFEELRQPKSMLAKKPATAELLGWLTALQVKFKTAGVPESAANALRDNPKIVKESLSVLVKNADDWKPATAVVNKRSPNNKQ